MIVAIARFFRYLSWLSIGCCSVLLIWFYLGGDCLDSVEFMSSMNRERDFNLLLRVRRFLSSYDWPTPGKEEELPLS